MEALNFTIVDWGSLAILVFAGLLGFSVGLIHGILFIASWAGAAVVAWVARPRVQPYVANYVSDETIAAYGTLAGVFLVAVIVFTLVAGTIGKVVRRSVIGGVDRFLGFGFGVICGAAMLSITYIVLVYIIKQGPMLDAIEQARSYDLIRRGAAVVEPYLPEQLRRTKESAPPGAAPAPPPRQ